MCELPTIAEANQLPILESILPTIAEANDEEDVEEMEDAKFIETLETVDDFKQFLGQSARELTAVSIDDAGGLLDAYKASSRSGFMNITIMLATVLLVDRWLTTRNAKRPFLWQVDGFGPHITAQVILLAFMLDIHIFQLVAVMHDQDFFKDAKKY